MPRVDKLILEDLCTKKKGLASYLCIKCGACVRRHNFLKSDTAIRLYNLFEETLIEIVDKHTPCKSKYIRANESAFMNKSIKKEIMHRAKLKNKSLQDPTISNETHYKRQECVV